MRRRLIFYSLCLLVSIMILFPYNLILADSSVEIIPTADTYVDSNEPDLNYGGNDLLKVANTTGLFSAGKQVSYLIFDISSVNQEITRAVFYIVTSIFIDATQVVGLSTLSNTDWSEYSITYNSQPSGYWNFISNQPIASSYEWYSWTIPIYRFINNKTCLVLNVVEEIDAYVNIWFESKDTAWKIDRPYIEVFYEAGYVSGFSLLITLISFLVLISLSKSKSLKTFQK